METVQIVLEEALLRATDRAARRQKVNRSALVRQALRQHLTYLATQELERRDRDGYERHPEPPTELRVWEKAAAWPDE